MARHAIQEGRSREEGLRTELQQLQEKMKIDIKALQHKLNDTEERLKGIISGVSSIFQLVKDKI